MPRIAEWHLSDDPAYVHLCTNETIDGVETFEIPDLGDIPLVADASSHILSRPMDIAKYGVLFGGAQKNIGMAGVTLVIVREDLLDRALPICPSAFEWKTVAENNSMYNTPPTYAIYIAGLVFKWLKKQGGLAAIEARNVEKAKLLYDTIDSSNFYVNKVERQSRSRMNVPFFLADESRNDRFPGRRESARAAATEGPQVRRRHAGIDLQRGAARGRASARRIHEGIRAGAAREPNAHRLRRLALRTLFALNCPAGNAWTTTQFKTQTAARTHRRDRRATHRASEPARRGGAGSRRGEEALQRAGVSPRARNAGDRSACRT